MRIEALRASHGAAWAALFEACASSCFCRYWHFRGSKNEWLARSAHEPEQSRREHLASLAEGDADARGLVAIEGALVVGWMKVAPRSRMNKLTSLPVYRRHEGPERDGAHVIGCVLVRPDRRRQGIARALVAAADAHVRAWGGRSLEAYPRRSEAPLHDEEAWMGPEQIFVDCGYLAVAGEAPYLVYRKTLAEQ